jgi:2-methylfumaryl-CoA isomerase
MSKIDIDLLRTWAGKENSIVDDLNPFPARALAAALDHSVLPGKGNVLPPSWHWLYFLDTPTAMVTVFQFLAFGITFFGDKRAQPLIPRGMPMITGPEEGNDVVNPVLPAWDLVTGQMAAVGLLAAERHRRITGKGQHIKLALEDVSLAVMGHLGLIAEAQLGHERERVGNYLFGAFGRDFICATGERVMVIGLTLKQWRSLCEATGLGGELDALAQRLNADFNREGDRYRARKDIAAVIEPWIARHSYAEVEAAFNQHSVCWSRYQSVQQMVSSMPNNPLFSTVQQPGVGNILTPGIPLDFSAFPRNEPVPAPRLGEHTEQVLSEVLGMSAGEYGKLHDRELVAG